MLAGVGWGSSVASGVGVSVGRAVASRVGPWVLVGAVGAAPSPLQAARRRAVTSPRKIRWRDMVILPSGSASYGQLFR